MTYEEALALCATHGQEQLLRHWDALDENAQSGLLEQLAALDFDRVSLLSSLLKEKAEGASVGDPSPADVTRMKEEPSAGAHERGEDALRAGQVGAVLVAGGQGSRLGYDGPKGCYEIGPISGATLFEIHCHKIAAMARHYDTRIPLYVMTSETNDTATRSFFEEHRFFNLDPADVMFFKQGMLPALTEDGKLILDEPGHIFMGPDGHGGMLDAMQARGVMQDLAERGITTLYYFQIDNPMLNIADPAFIGRHLEAGAEVSVKVCAKRDASEKVGVVAVRDGKTCIVEYSDLTEEQTEARTESGELLFNFGSVAIHVFSVDFIERCLTEGLPYHIAHKKVPYCDKSGLPVTPDAPNAYKFEKFIFDTLPIAESVLNIEFDRADEFSPVKNAEGEDSPATTRRDMSAKAIRWLAACGVTIPDGIKVEIDPLYAWNVNTLKDRVGDGSGLDLSGDLLLKG